MSVGFKGARLLSSESCLGVALSILLLNRLHDGFVVERVQVHSPAQVHDPYSRYFKANTAMNRALLCSGL